MTPTSPPTGLLLSDDLIFTSRIAGVAVSHGLVLRTARSPEALLALARESSPTGVVLDLQNPGLDLSAVLAELGQLLPRPRIVAYGSHVAADVLRAARAAGCDLVLPRSKFVEVLPTDLPAWLAVPGINLEPPASGA